MSGSAPTGGWRALGRSHPRIVVLLSALIACLVVGDATFGVYLFRYRREAARLRAGMSDTERQRADMIESTEQNRLSVTFELIRRQASGDRDLHLSVALDSGTMLLERDRARLREMPVEVGAERLVGTPPDGVQVIRPRGARTVERVLGARDRWEIPAWVFADRGLPVPADRRLSGVLGRNALVLSGGTVIYALPDSGILADSGYVLPGAVRVARADLRAIVPIISPGLTVYFYE